MLNVEYMNLGNRDPNFGTPVICYACSTPHKARGLARITDSGGVNHLPLCQACVRKGDRDHAVIKKYLGAPDLQVTEGAGGHA